MKSCDVSIGRRYEDIEVSSIKDPFLDDYTRIITSKAYRRLAYKAQAIVMPENPHVSTRLVHTNEVTALSMRIAGMLGLNQSLCMAIAAGHDLGHTPFGHPGERALSEVTGKKFKHCVNGVVIAQKIERRGKGLNLAYETLEGILYHSRINGPLEIDKEKPDEYSVVMFADKISYLFSDLEDAVRYGHLSEDRVPTSALRLGDNTRARIRKVIGALIEESTQKEFVQFSEGEVFNEFNEFREFMYNEFYYNYDDSFQKNVIVKAYEFFSKEFPDINPAVAVSLLTDAEASSLGDLVLRNRRLCREQIKDFGVIEIIPYLRDKKIDYTSADLNKADFSK